jgi:hypothetical protein
MDPHDVRRALDGVDTVHHLTAVSHLWTANPPTSSACAAVGSPQCAACVVRNPAIQKTTIATDGTIVSPPGFSGRTLASAERVGLSARRPRRLRATHEDKREIYEEE